VLRGEVSTFSLELPPYRPPRIWQTLYTSFIDRTLYRAVAGDRLRRAGRRGHLADRQHQIGGRAWPPHGPPGSIPLGLLLGLNGVILLAYIVAIPGQRDRHADGADADGVVSARPSGAGAGVMFELDSDQPHRGAHWCCCMTPAAGRC
jgi:ferrous iron transport protein B